MWALTFRFVLMLFVEVEQTLHVACLNYLIVNMNYRTYTYVQARLKFDEMIAFVEQRSH